MEWKDITTYSRFDKKRIPRILEYRLNKELTIIVHRHICDESTWFVTIHGTKINMVDLHTDDLATAKNLAIEIFIAFLNEKIVEYKFAVEKLKEKLSV